MVEVFRTNVKDHKQADFLLQQLGEIFAAYEINFDLEDCDNILRVESGEETIQVFKIVTLLNDFGFTAELLPDTPKFEESIAIAVSNGSNQQLPTD